MNEHLIPPPTVSVDVENVRPGYLASVNGLTAKILKTVPPKTDGGFRCPNYHLAYVLLDPPPAGMDDLGSLDVPEGSAVDCVRVADWLAARTQAPPADPWSEPGDQYTAWAAARRDDPRGGAR